MSELKYDPKASPLTDDETKAAVQELVDTFPKVTRNKNDPAILGQEYTNLSFMLLKQPVDGVYGFVKPRGSWPDVDKATLESEKLIKFVDSVFKIHIAPTGYWSPITNNERYASDQMDVKTREQDQALRDRASKEAQARNMEMQREMNERKEQLKDDKDDTDFDPESLDYYTKKRVSMKELNSYILQANEKMKTLKKSLRKIEKEVKEINRRHPQYMDQWIDNYNKARARVGLDPVSESDPITVIGQI